MKIALVIVVFASVVLAFFSDVIFRDRVLVTSSPAQYDPWRHYADQDQLNAKTFNPDALLYYVPRRTELSLSIGEGRLPLWNPYIFCGTPFFANLQNRVLYPVSLLLVPFDPMRAMGYEIAIHVFLALVGMYLFLRIVGCSTLGAVLSALTYGFSSFFFTRMGHPTFLATASWIPFIFYGFEKGRKRERTGTILLTVFLAMGYLAGFPQVLLFGVMGLVLYAFWVSLEAPSGMRVNEIARSARILAISGLLSVLVVSVQLIPFGELIRNSSGLGFSLDRMSRTHMWPPISLLRTIVPNFFGNPADGTSWRILIKQGGPADNPGFFVYCGVGSILLVCGSLALITRSKRIMAFLVILAASIGLGTCPFFLRVGYAIIPFIGYSKIDRVSVLACFAISALSGITFSKVFRSEERREREWFIRLVLIAIVIVLAAFMAFVAMRQTAAAAFLKGAARLPPQIWEEAAYSRVDEWLDGKGDSWLAFEIREVGKAALFLLLGGAFLLLSVIRRPGRRRLSAVAGVFFILCLLIDVGLAARGYYITQPAPFMPETEGIGLLKHIAGRPGEWRTARYVPNSPVLPPNAGQVFHIPCLGGRSSIVPDAHSTFLHTVPSRDETRARHRRMGNQLSDDAFRLACARYVLLPCAARTTLPEDYRLVYDGDLQIYENTGALEKGVCLPKATVGVEKVAGREVLGVYHALTSPEIGRCGTVRIAGYEPECVIVDVDADEPCFLIFQDNFYPGWKAYVDGEKGEILRTDLGFRAIEVDEGEHNIVMRFRPWSLRLGIFATCVGILASLFYLWKPRFRGRSTGSD